MRLIEKLPLSYHFRLRDFDERDDVNIRADHLLAFIKEHIETESGNCDCIFDPDIDDNTLSSKSVGNIDVGTSAGSLRGLSFTELFVMALFKAVPPTYLGPTLVLHIPSSKLFEVGTYQNVSLVSTYAQNNAGSTLSISITRDGTGIAATLNHTDSGLTSSIPKQFEYRTIVAFDDGPILNDSYGNPYPAGKIQSGTINSNIETVKFTYPYFWGISPTPSITNIASGNKVLQDNLGTLNINFGSSPNDYLWFAVPATQANYTAWEVDVLNSGNIGNPGDLFVTNSTIPVTTINWNNINYKLYVSDYSTQVTSNMKIT